ncbi:hypothetical protein FOCC_FOCC015087 [Frankliniella occidentalis]|nr:hypothetical protein FOCC_FOCC015087 [Frankliniella occidentalis]
MYRWEKQVEAGGSHRDKLKEVSRATYDKFLDLKNRHQKVNTLDLRRIALLKAREINCTNFKASESWADLFKKKHNIVSRKITKFVSKKDLTDKEIIKDKALDFVLESMELFDTHDRDKIVNTDQSGFELEMHSGRTLDTKGVKKVEIIAQSKSALTHSYTIMPTVTASGKLLEPLYMVLREDSGTFGPIVSKTMFRPANVFLSASKSGKMGLKHLDKYIENVAVPNLAPRGVLVVDSWSAFSDDNIMKSIPGDMELVIKQIPEGATGMVQPLDVYGFRIWKNYVKHISQFIILNEIPFCLRQRDSITKLQSLTYRQLGSPRFTGLFQYSWYKSGYIGERPDFFPNPVKFCFHGTDLLCSSCTDLRLLTCSWCKTNLCAHHFLVENHLCDTYVP